jgi:hypothetical protein
MTINLKRIYDMVIRPWPPITDVGELADFIDAQAAFVCQKGIYEYSRARAGHYAKVLFSEPEFIEAVDQSRWRAYPLGLAMVGELVEGVLRPHAGGDHLRQLDALRGLVVSVFDRYPVPVTLSQDTWREARRELARRLDHIGLHAVKFAKDIPEPFAQSYFDIMPIHKKLKTSEAPTIRNYLRVTMCNIHEELTRRMDAKAVGEQLRAHAS